MAADWLNPFCMNIFLRDSGFVAPVSFHILRTLRAVARSTPEEARVSFTLVVFESLDFDESGEFFLSWLSDDALIRCLKRLDLGWCEVGRGCIWQIWRIIGGFGKTSILVNEFFRLNLGRNCKVRPVQLLQYVQL